MGQLTKLSSIALTVILTACGGGGGGDSSGAVDQPSTPLPSVALARTIINPGNTCPMGGFEVDLGIDSNTNGVLDSDEINSTEVICNGLNGTDGANGSDGQNGSDGLVTLVALSQVSNIEQCLTQGVKIEAGLDTNLNNVLDSAEVTATSYLCDGTTSNTSNQTIELSGKGNIKGNLNLSTNFLPQSLSLNNATGSNVMARKVTVRKVTSQTGELWLTPSDIFSAIQADQAATDQAQLTPASDALLPPIVEAIQVPVENDGSFEISVPAGTDYELTYTTPDGSQGVQVANLAVEPGTDTPVIIEENSLQATGSVQVALQSLTNGTNLQDVRVVLLNGGIDTQTDVSGVAMLENLAPGQYTLMAHIDGYVSKTFSFNVASGVNTDLGILELNNQRGKASGTVQAFGLSSQANIIVYARDLQGTVYTTLTDSNGIFTFNALPVGMGYSFIAQANDFNSSKQDNIQIELGRTASVGNIELAPITSEVGSITGFAKFSELQNSQDVHAGIIVSVEGTDKEAITSRDGAYVINGLAAGTYTLNFTDSNHQTQTLQDVIVAKTTISNLQPQSLISLTGSLSGKVVDANNSAIANATLLIQQTGVTVQTDANGAFTFSDVYAGDFTLAVSKDGYQGFTTIVAVQANSTKALGDLNIDAFLINGNINLGGVDHAGALVSIKGSAFTAVTDNNGDFTLSGMPAGDYELQVSVAGYQTQTINAAISNAQPATNLANTINLIQYSLSGSATLASMGDHSAITISLLGTAFTAQTDSNGDFSLAGMSPGNYQLQISKAGYQVKTVAVNISDANPAVALGSAVALAPFVIDGVAQLFGAGDHSAITVSVLGTAFTAQTDTDGAFNIAGLSAGNYQLQISKSGYQLKTLLVNLSNAQPSVTLANTVSLAQFSLTGSVSLSDNADNSAVTISLLGTSYTTQTDSNGAFTLAGLELGNYKLLASKAGYQNQETTVSISSDVPSAILNYGLTLEPAVGLVAGVVTLENQVAHGGVTVELINSAYSTQTDNLGNWSLTVPVGNYGGGIRYSKSLFGSTDVNETATVTSNGTYTAQASTLYQQAVRTILPLTATAACSQLSAVITGINATNYSNTVAAVNGQVIVDLPIGDYRIETLCSDAGFESVLQELTVTANGDTQTTLSAIELRTRFLNIDEGSFTNVTSINLSLGAGDATQMRLQDDATDTGWITFEETYAWTLSAGDGNKTITASYKNDVSALGDESASIALDTGISVASFTASGASKKGDTLTLSLNLTGETGAQVQASFGGLFTNLPMFDDGLGGDVTANDGTYTRKVQITSANEFNAAVTANITDRAGNSTTANTSALVLITNPSIKNIQTQSDLATAQLAISFDTDELTTTTISYGNAPGNLTNSATISASLEQVHNITLASLNPNELVYYQVTATDNASNATSKTGFVKLAPSAPKGVIAQAGNNDLGVVWDVMPYLYINGYNVYRSEDNASWTKVNTTGLLGTPYYYDTSVNNDQVYYYKVTSVDVDGNESIDSAVVSATPIAALAGPTQMNEAEIYGNNIWLASHSPISFSEKVSAYSTARIWTLPGTEILFSEAGELNLHEQVADLYMLGSEAAPVKITADATKTANKQISMRVGNQYSGAYSSLTAEDPSLTVADALKNRSEDARGFLTHGMAAKNIIVKNAYVDLANNYYQLPSTADGVVLDGEYPEQSILRVRTVNDASNNDQNLGDNNPYTYGHRVEAYLLKESTLDMVALSVNKQISGSTLTNIASRNLSGVVVNSSLALQDHPNHYMQPAYIDLVLNSSFSGRNASSGYFINSNVSELVCDSAIALTQNVWFGTTDKTELIATGCFDENIPESFMGLRSHVDPAMADYDSDGTVDMLDADRDNDGINDWQELNVQPSGSIFDVAVFPTVNETDTDYDGISDATDTDDDNDGVADVDEVSAGTDPLIVDSDLDGVSDWGEINYGYDPLDKNNMPLTQINAYASTIDSRFAVNGNEVIIVRDDKPRRHLPKTLESNGVSLWDVNLTDDFYYQMAAQLVVQQGSIRGIGTVNVSLHGSPNGSYAEQLEYGYDQPYNIFENVDFNHVQLEFIKATNATFMSVTAGQHDDATIKFSGYFENSVLGKEKSSTGVTAYTTGEISAVNSRLIFGPLYNSNYGPISVEGSYLSIWTNSSRLDELRADRSIIDTGSNGYTGYALADKGVVSNSIITDQYASTGNTGMTYVNSDIYMSDSQNTKTFYNSSYVKFGKTVIADLGTPEDQLGDGIVDTVLNYTDEGDAPQTVTIDGITQPKSTPHYPGGNSDLWNGLGVGAH